MTVLPQTPENNKNGTFLGTDTLVLAIEPTRMNHKKYPSVKLIEYSHKSPIQK